MSAFFESRYVGRVGGSMVIAHRVEVGGHSFTTVSVHDNTKFFVDDVNVGKVMFEATLCVLNGRARAHLSEGLCELAALE